MFWGPPQSGCMPASQPADAGLALGGPERDQSLWRSPEPLSQPLQVLGNDTNSKELCEESKIWGEQGPSIQALEIWPRIPLPTTQITIL